MISGISRKSNRFFIVVTSLVSFLIVLTFAAPLDEVINQPTVDVVQGNEGIAPGNDRRCPEHMLFHDETRKCYESRLQGPCQNNLKLMFSETVEISKDNLVKKGVCKCLEQGQIDGYTPIIFPNIYHGNQNKCFQLYTQGFCPDGHWIVYEHLKAQGGLLCEKNPCSQDQNLKNPVFVEGRCASLGSNCTFSPKRGLVGFANGDLFPSCGFSESPEFLSIASLNKIPCGGLKRRDLNGDCQELVKFQ